MKFLGKFLFSLILGSLPLSGVAKADAFDWMKGCIIMGATTAGGAALSASVSNTKMVSTDGMVFAGVTGCLIGGFLVGDVVRKAEMKSEGELKAKRENLKMGVFSVQHDLRVLKGESGPDGEPYEKKSMESESSGAFQSLRSGN
jgi:hypothetical protein